MTSYREDLLSDLQNPEYAAEYLTAARKESQQAFLMALRDVAEARMGIAGIAIDAGVNRENLYRMLSAQGNPRLSTLDAVLGTIGIDYRFVAGVYTNRNLSVAPESIKYQNRRLRLGRRPRPPVITGRTRKRILSASLRRSAGSKALFLPTEPVGISSVPVGNNALSSKPWPVYAGQNVLIRGQAYAG